jgi:hypothetical protein
MKDPFNQKGMEGTRQYAKYIAIVVRNAIYTAIYAFESRRDSKMAEAFLDFHCTLTQQYSEEPELLPGFGDLP